jgi:hypothetical protein
MKRFVATIAVLMLFVGAAAAQQADLADLKESAASTPLGTQPTLTPSGLLDFSRLKFSHSYSVSFFSGGGVSSSLGMLNSTMFYEFSPKLSLAVNVGVLHNPGALWGNGPKDATLLPGFHLDYHPSEKFRMSVSFQQYSGYFSPYSSPFYRPSLGRLYPY